MALSDESNHQLLERDLRYACEQPCRRRRRVGTFIEYGTKDRRKDRESYAEMWRGGFMTTTTAATSYRWRSTVWSFRTTSSKRHGTQSEQGLRARGRAVLRHRWLANYWRIDPMTDKTSSG